MIEYLKNGTVRVSSDSGVVRIFTLSTFNADPAGCVAATGNGIAPPASPKDELATLKAKLVEKNVLTADDVK